MKHFRLIRFDAVLMLLLMQCLMSFAVISPILEEAGLERATPAFSLFIIMLGTAFMAMGASVINAYFDVRIDDINKPQKVLIGRVISRQRAMLLHQVLTASGILCGLVAAWQAHSSSLAMIFVFVPGLLWFYASTYKRQFFIGNFIIALVTAFVPLIMAVVENSFLPAVYGGSVAIKSGLAAELYRWVGFFTLFVFALSLLREMVKDLREEKGNRELESRTVPIVLGTSGAKFLIAFMTILLIAGVFAFVRIYAVSNEFLKHVLLYAVCTPLLYFSLFLH